jgi:hypothetical protein
MVKLDSIPAEDLQDRVLQRNRNETPEKQKTVASEAAFLGKNRSAPMGLYLLNLQINIFYA